jgi:hypothetical protein
MHPTSQSTATSVQPSPSQFPSLSSAPVCLKCSTCFCTTKWSAYFFSAKTRLNAGDVDLPEFDFVSVNAQIHL